MEIPSVEVRIYWKLIQVKGIFKLVAEADVCKTLQEVFLTAEYLAIAMEYVPGGDMFQHVKRHKGLPEPEVKAVAHLFLSQKTSSHVLTNS